MSILSKLFGKRNCARSRLEDFLSRLTPDAIRDASRKGSSEEIRVASLISLLVLSRAHAFAHDTIASAEELSRKVGGHAATPVSYDVIAYEVAAFTHYSLLAPFLGAPGWSQDELDEDDDLDDEDPYFRVLQSAARLSAGFLQDFTDFGLSEAFFVNRTTAYVLSQRKSDPLTEFDAIVSQSLEGGHPRAGFRGRPLLDLSLGMAVKLAIPAFATHMLPALATAARNAFDMADELGLSD